MMSAIDLRDRLYDLSKKLLRAPRLKTAPRRRRDAIREGKRDREYEVDLTLNERSFTVLDNVSNPC